MTRLEQLRLDRLMTPEELAKDAKVGAATVRRLERGHGAQIETLRKLSEFFDVPASELLGPARGVAA